MEHSNADIDKLWQENTDTLRQFLDNSTDYAHLCEEVAYILQKKINQFNIEYSAITFRAKSLNSFCGKITRKQYKEPLAQITDLAGVRIVYLYKNDLNAIENIIESEFKVIEKVDKLEDSGDDRFGYGATHYIVKLGKASSGARYDDLKKLLCEIQVRTVLQDSWAIIAHHLSYKQESDVPRELKRKLNSLSGLFETADDQFDRLKEERQQYINKIKENVTKKDIFLQQDINLDTLNEYMSSRIPGYQNTRSEDTSKLVESLTSHGYKKISQLEHVFSKGFKAYQLFEKECYPDGKPSPIGVIRHLIRIVDVDFDPINISESTSPITVQWAEAYKKYRVNVK
ncbi:MAG: hypothetical protein NT087_11550 [Deltaproteobacteria bacterium]|nr:hypothetical protein [Deltaproteobacteria bacterium]